MATYSSCDATLSVKESTRTGSANPLIVAGDDKQSGDKHAGPDRRFFQGKLSRNISAFFFRERRNIDMS